MAKRRIKIQKGFVQIPLLIGIIVSVAIISVGGFGGLEYYKISKIIKEAEQLKKEEKYGEAIKKLEIAQNKLFGKLLLKQKIKAELEINKEFLEDKLEYTQGIEEFKKGNLEKAKELLSKISDTSPYYQEAKNKIEEITEKQTAESMEKTKKEVKEEKAKRIESEIEIPKKEVQEGVRENEEKGAIKERVEEVSKTKYATIVKLTDSKGNIQLQSEYNGKNNTWPSPWPKLKVGETITIKVEVDNPSTEPILYKFVGNGFPNTWQTENQVTVTIDDNIFNLETIHLRVFVKNSDNQYRAPDYDDMIQVFYKKEAIVGTEVKGIISLDTTWSLMNSPYIVSDNILIEENAHLIIEPGVEIRFNRGKYIQIMGYLKAIGTKNHPIVFTSNPPGYYYPEGWELKLGKYREGSKGGNLQLKYCKIERGIIRTESYAYDDRDFNNLMIENSIFDGGAIWTEGPGIRSYIKYNDFLNANRAIYINTGKSNPLEISYNNFKKNKVAIYIGPVSPSGVQIKSNNFYLDNEIAVWTENKDDIDISGNWWGTTDTSIIDTKIFDFYDNFNLGKLNYQPIAISEISVAGVQ